MDEFLEALAEAIRELRSEKTEKATESTKA